MDDDKKKKSLDPNDIQTEHNKGEEVSRRSVLGILGNLAVGGTAATVLEGCYRRTRAAYNTSGGGYTGVTDSDGGPYADPAGNGRGTARAYGTGITDSDGGPYADAVGNGRGRGRAYGGTGITDSDSGAYADPAGNGRGGGYRGGVTDRDPYDPAGRGRGGYR